MIDADDCRVILTGCAVLATVAFWYAADARVPLDRYRLKRGMAEDEARNTTTTEIDQLPDRPA